MNTLRKQINDIRQRPGVFMRQFLFAAVVVAIFMALPVGAQEPTLDLDADTVTTGLFAGANIVIAALGAIMFLLAGFRLGGTLLRGIVDAVGGIRF